jgi:hypothetical protein
MKQSETESKYPVAIFELIPRNRNGSGFVREDTMKSDNPIRIIHPRNRVIINRSVVRVPSKKDPKTMIEETTRFIYGQEEIFVKNQEEMKIHPNPNRDKITFINGFLTVPKDGAFVGLYEWFMTHAQNETNPNRIKRLKPLFREIKPEKQAHDKNVPDFQVAKAMGLITKLVKEKNGSYEYDEEGINVIAAEFGVQADSPAQQVAALIAIAKATPVSFLEVAEKGVQTVSIEIKHALQLRLIQIEGNVIAYNDGTKIKEFSNAQNTEAKKLSALGSYFQKVDGKEAYELFKQKLAAAKETSAAQV